MKVKRIIEIDEDTFKHIDEAKSVPDMFGTDIVNGLNTIKFSKPYNPSGDCISREQIRKSLNEAFGCENATKYGNQNAEQQKVSYSTLMLYEIADIVEDCCDNAPTVEARPQGDLISREELKKAIREYAEPSSKLSDDCSKGITECACEILDMIDNAPTVEVRPQGEWIYKNYHWVCDKCWDSFMLSSDFCPNCGADMRGDEE